MSMGDTVADNQSDKLARAYARLRALKENMPQYRFVNVFFVQEYHEALKHLEGLGFDVAEFKVPDHHITRTTILSGRSHVVPRSLLLTKLDAVLAYFELVTQKPPVTIGFKPPSSG
jgi:hypothetical protein